MTQIDRTRLTKKVACRNALGMAEKPESALVMPHILMPDTYPSRGTALDGLRSSVSQPSPLS